MAVLPLVIRPVVVIRPEAARPPAVVIRLEVELRPVLVIRPEAARPPAVVIRLEAAPHPEVVIRPAVATRLVAVVIRLAAVGPPAVVIRLEVIPRPTGGPHRVGRPITLVLPRTAVPRKAAPPVMVRQRAVPASHRAGRAMRERRLLERSPMP